jgi:hypothetical protein
LDFDFRPGNFQRLQVRVGGNELDAIEMLAIMLLMALPPAPPTPMTLILADFSGSM